MEHRDGWNRPVTIDRPLPRATYRLQLHKSFGFGDVARLAPYLSSLGVSHAYLSPILMARPGSTHGYDTVDHSRINPELGTLDDFRGMAETLRQHGLGIILDIVPNHMGIGGADNPYWLDVLEKGNDSPYSAWFDINWHPAEPSLDGRILVPFLDRSYDEALEAGLLTLRLDAADGRIALWLPGGHKLPLAPATYTKGDAEMVERLDSSAGRRELDTLLTRQHWRVTKANFANDEINYRRFFIVSDLAGIRIERPEVFEHVHRLIFQLIGEGLVDGLRIDHVDGLFDPKAYCRRLREQSPRPIYIVVEKILAEGEPLPADWDVEGTTGYEFATLVNPLLVDPDGCEPLSDFYREFTGSVETPANLEWTCKQRVMERELQAELDALSYRFADLARRTPSAGDLSRLALKRGLRALVAAMPTYRTYVDKDGPSENDRKVIAAAMQLARSREPELDDHVLAFIEAVLLFDEQIGDRQAALDLAMRLQQFTGPVMAKGLEDTALYRFNRLISLNDVGERPDKFTESIAAFHAVTTARAEALPHSMLATSTHDSKRGEDTRARIAALSGHAETWIAAIPEWVEMLRQQGAPAIAPDDAYVFFQMLVGAWPGATSEVFADRVWGAMQKSLREARLRSDWAAPDIAYEEAVEHYVRVALADAGPNPFLETFRRFEAVIGPHGAANGLIEATLKLTLPGVPDIYQGAELWEQSLVDPDNRRPVDFSLRERLFDQIQTQTFADLADHWRDGSIKQLLVTRLLRFRSLYPSLFAEGSYEPMRREDLDASAICAFVRRHGADLLFVGVRLYPWRAGAQASLELDIGESVSLTNVLTGETAQQPKFSAGLPIAIFAKVA